MLQHSHTHEPIKTNPLTKSVSLKSLLNLVKRTSQVNRVLYRDLSFNQATGLINQSFGISILKFSRMELVR